MPTYRTHLVHEWTRPNVSASWDATSPLFPYHQPSSDPSHPISNLHDQESPAWIGQRMLLDGVGGVSTLVRADVHRFGAVFPSWPVDNEVETEGFGVLSRKLGARVVGLPNYLVWHACESLSCLPPLPMSAVHQIDARFFLLSDISVSDWPGRGEVSPAVPLLLQQLRPIDALSLIHI